MLCLQKKKEFSKNESVYRGFLALSNNLTFEECLAANHCSIDRDDGEGVFFAEKIRKG